MRLGREEGQALGTDGYYELGHESVAADPAEECAYREHRAEGSIHWIAGACPEPARKARRHAARVRELLKGKQ